MAYRSFSTDTWNDPWFEKLGPYEKLLFIYLWTNDVCNQAGCYQISMKRVEFETGLKPEKIIDSLKPKVEWFPESQIIWIKNFFRRQCANDKFAIAGIRSLSCVPKYISEKFGIYNLSILNKYGIDTVSIPYKTEFDTLCESVTRISTDTVTDTDTGPARAGARARVSLKQSGFDDFWAAYPKKIGKIEAQKAWSKSNGNRPPTEVVLQKIGQLKKSAQWKKQGGQFVPNPATWINRGGWEDEPQNGGADDECPGFDWSKSA